MAGKVIVLGAGFSGLSAAASLAQLGFKVEVIEKHASPGGRARNLESGGFDFDMGSSFYLMPEVYNSFFEKFGYKSTDFYSLIKSEHAFRLFSGDGNVFDIPYDIGSVGELIGKNSIGDSTIFQKKINKAFVSQSQRPGYSKYNSGQERIYKNLLKAVSGSISGFSPSKINGTPINDLSNIFKIINGNRYQSPDDLAQNLVTLLRGSLYPSGGFKKIAESMEKICIEQGVEFAYNVNVDEFDVVKNRVMAAHSGHRNFYAENFVSSADYVYTEQKLLPEAYRNYIKKYWESKTLSPSVLIYFVGLNKKLEGISHHNFIIEENIEKHCNDIWKNPRWPESPSFYVQAKSKIEPASAPEGCESITIMVPVSALLEDHGKVREHYFDFVISSLEKKIQAQIRENIVFYKSYAKSSFMSDYNAYMGNAYGFLNKYGHSAGYSLKIKNRHLSNLYYTGHMTIPGPGVHNAIISGELISHCIFRDADGHKS